MNWRSSESGSHELGATATSRAVNVTANKDEVFALCAKHDAAISAIEVLPAGGTRVVLCNADDAALIRKAMKAKLIVGSVARTPWGQS